MAETPIGPGGPEGIELPKVEVDVNTPEDFEGGVDVTDDGQGGAILQSLEGMEVETEVYDHNANLADVLDENPFRRQGRADRRQIVDMRRQHRDFRSGDFLGRGNGGQARSRSAALRIAGADAPPESALGCTVHRQVARGQAGCGCGAIRKQPECHIDMCIAKATRPCCKWPIVRSDL